MRENVIFRRKSMSKLDWVCVWNYGMRFTTDDRSTPKNICLPNSPNDCVAIRRKEVLTNWLPYKATWAKEKAYGSDQRLTNVGDQEDIMIFTIFSRNLTWTIICGEITWDKYVVTPIYHLVNLCLLVERQPSEKGQIKPKRVRQNPDDAQIK